MKRRILQGDPLILGAVITWAFAFPIAKDALDPTTGWGNFTCSFLALRFCLAFAIFLPPVLWRYGLTLKKYIWPSIWVGGSLVVAYLFQSWAYTCPAVSSGKVAFITALAVVFVPLWSWLCGKPVAKATASGIVLATVGLGFMTLKSDFYPDQGALLALVGALGFAADIILVGKYRRLSDEHGRPLLDALPFTTMQFLVIALVMAPLGLVFEIPAGRPPMSGNVLLALLYLAGVATALGFTLQAIGQRYTNDVRVALLSTLEPVIATIAGFLILNEAFTTPMLVGAALILLGTTVAEVSAALV